LPEKVSTTEKKEKAMEKQETSIVRAGRASAGEPPIRLERIHAGDPASLDTGASPPI
jgi:hypothetical protein